MSPNPHNIADVSELLEDFVVVFLSYIITANIYLDLPRRILEIKKSGFTHNAARHNTSRYRHLFNLVTLLIILFKELGMFQNIPALVGNFEFVWIGIRPRLPKFP